MIPNSNVKTVEGSLGGKRTPMQFEANATAHLMQMMSNLYSDTELAVIREYATNALDSQRMSGIDRPIEIELPTQLISEFVVRDFGLGLSEAELTHLLGNYGASTKRETNVAAGFYGVGSKAALALVNTFSVRAVKDGVFTLAVVYVGTDGAGVVEVIDTGEVSESNGVEVRIPVNPSYSFNEKVRDFFKYWDKGSVLIDGQQPASFMDAKNIIEVEPGLYIDPDGSYWDSYVVMGGTPYKIDSGLYVSTMNRNLGVVVIADIGDVDHTPNREALHYTPRVKDFLVTLANHVNNMYERAISERIASTTSLEEVVRLGVALNMHEVSFKGQKIDLRGRQYNYEYDLGYNRMSSSSGYYPVEAYGDDTRILINKPTFSILSTKQRKKVKMWRDQHAPDVTTLIQFEGKVPAAVAEGNLVDWADIDAMEVPKVSRPKAPRSKTVPMQDRELATVQRGDNGTRSRKVDTTKRVFWVLNINTTMGSYYKPSKKANPDHYYRFIEDYLPHDVQIVFIAEFQEEYFKRTFPDAQPFKNLVKEQIKASNIRLTKFQKQALAADQHLLTAFKDNTDDPMIDRLAQARFDSDLVDRVQWRKYYAGRETGSDEFKDYFDRYPLINGYHRNFDDKVDYINAMYYYSKRRKK